MTDKQDGHAIHQQLSPEQQFQQTQRLLEFNEDMPVADPGKALRQMVHTRHTNAVMVFVEDLRVKPDFNPRIQDEEYHKHIRSLADSMKREGFKPEHPVTGIIQVTKGKPKVDITDGACRYAAVLLAISEGARDIQEIPVILKDKSTTIEDLTWSLAEANGGKHFTTLEMAVVVKRLKRFGNENKVIAERLGMTPERVGQLLTLAGAPRVIREMIEKGEIAAGLALDTYREMGPDAAEVLTTAAAAKKAEAGGVVKKVTARDLPTVIYKRAVVKSAPALVDVVREVQTSVHFAALPDELREKIDRLLKEIADAKEGKKPEKVKGKKEKAVKAEKAATN